MEAGIPASRCVVLLLYKLPFIVVQIGPVGFLLSILIALGLMSKHNEVIALKSCGIGKSRLLKPTLTLDDGADLIFTVHNKHPEMAASVIGAVLTAGVETEAFGQTP